MKLLSIIVFLILSAIALLHAYWALGGLWPAATEQALIKTVVGAPGMTRMFSTETTFLVAGLIGAAGIVALFTGGVLSFAPNWFARLGAGVLAFVFIARGIAGYAVKAMGVEQTEPFATLDLWLYSPLCLIIGAAFIILLLNAHPSKRNQP